MLIQNLEDGWPVQGQREKPHLLGHSHFIGRLELMESMIAGFINIDSVAFGGHVFLKPLYFLLDFAYIFQKFNGQIFRVSKATRATNQTKAAVTIATEWLKVVAAAATQSFRSIKITPAAKNSVAPMFWSVRIVNGFAFI